MKEYIMKKLRKLSLILILSLFTFTSNAQEKSSQETLRTVENYLNNSRTLMADFEQIDSNGKLSHGKFYLSRPGKLRLQYTDPSPLTIVADGQFLIHHDSSTKEITTMAISETPAEFILRQHIRFNEDVKMIKFQEEKNYYKVTLARSSTAETGTLTLKFSKNPLKLVQWIVVDSQGLDTTVNLTNLKSNTRLDQNLFIFQEVSP
jgi:outer membrane lipoprotein-sorting protein